MVQILSILSLFLFVLLIILGIISYQGLPCCISDIYYKIGHWFTLLLGGASFCLVPAIIELTPITFLFTAFFICAALAFVAFAPNYKECFEHSVHMGGAIISALSAIVWTALIQPYALFVLLISGLALIDKKHYMFWGELSCFVMVFAAVFLCIF